MSINVTWLGHATWLIEVSGVLRHTLVLDPFLTDSPSAPRTAAEVTADVILVSHGHFDHLADAAAIANRTDATLVANFEIANWFAKQHGVKNTLGMNIGGQAKLDFGTVKMTQALHSSQLPDGSYGGNPGGYVLTLDGATIYFACDTALFSDMRLIGNMGIDLAVLPIGDLFTMGIDDSIEAIKLIRPKTVLPSHYNTWAPIAQDANVWARRVEAETAARPIVLQPGESHKL